MSKTPSLTLITILLHISVFASGNYQDWWQKGNQYYEQKNYDSAAYYYNRLAKLQPTDAEIYYNLGNTYYRLNLVGAAVLNYERALKYAPNHQLAADNLYLTQSRIKNRIQVLPEIFFIRWWKSITQNNLTNVYAGIAVVLFILLLGYHIAKRLGVLRMNIPMQVSAAAVALCLVFVFLSLMSARRVISANYAIVMRDGAPIMREAKYGTPLSEVPEGTKVTISDSKATWYEITLPDGRNGWMQQASLEKI